VVRLDAPSKITNLNDIAVFDQYVLGLDISMNETLLMQIVNSGTNLDKEVKCCIFTQELFFSNEIEQISFRGILKSKVNGGFVLKTCVETTNVLMI
jgi:hypothetical protein